MARRTFGSVRRLRSGRWQVRYTKDGRQVSLPGTHPTKADAGRALARLQSDMDRGSYVDPKAGGIIFAKYSEGWLASRLVKGQPLAPRTRELYRWQLAKYLQPTFGAIELRRLTADAVRAWHATLSGPAGPGALTAAKCYRLLRAILNTALEDGLIAANPCTIRGAGREQISDRTMLTPEQIGRVAEELGPRYRAVILLAAWAGLRFGELAGLRRSRLDLDAGVVTVAEAVSYLPEGVRHVGPPKSEAGRRTVAIPPHIIPALREHLDLFAEPGNDGLVFVGPKGGLCETPTSVGRYGGRQGRGRVFPARSHCMTFAAFQPRSPPGAGRRPRS